MPDRYADFATLARFEREGVDYRVRVRRLGSAFAILAPHGGGIEPGTSEIAEAIADPDRSFYAFEGIKGSGNAALHVTSTRFDEPQALALASCASTIVAIHGEASAIECVYVGGRDTALGERVSAALRAGGFHAATHPDPALRGTDWDNLCNRGKSGAGLQLEISRATRASLFATLTRAGRDEKRPRFQAMVDAIRSVLE